MAKKKRTKLDKVRIAVALKYPFQAAIMLQQPFVVDESIEAIQVDPDGYIHYNSKFVKRHSIKNLAWGVAHELLHYAYLRRKKRPESWQVGHGH